MEQLVEIAKILSDINRLKMIALMHRDKELCVCEFGDTLQLSQPLVSRNLKQMRDAGIVQSRKSGKWMLYSLTQHPLLECFLQNIAHTSDTLPKLVSCSVKKTTEKDDLNFFL